jgi:hypothetical protein
MKYVHHLRKIFFIFKTNMEAMVQIYCRLTEEKGEINKGLVCKLMGHYSLNFVKVLINYFLKVVKKFV